jgi:hypothetical protein
MANGLPAATVAGRTVARTDMPVAAGPRLRRQEAVPIAKRLAAKRME